MLNVLFDENIKTSLRIHLLNFSLAASVESALEAGKHLMSSDLSFGNNAILPINNIRYCCTLLLFSILRWQTCNDPFVHKCSFSFSFLKILLYLTNFWNDFHIILGRDGLLTLMSSFCPFLSVYPDHSHVTFNTLSLSLLLSETRR